MKYLFVFIVFTLQIMGQEKIAWDTTRYQKFNNNLIVGIFQSYYNFNNEFNQSVVPDSAGISHNHYKSESKLFTGIAVTYDKFSFALGLQSKPQDNSQGKGRNNTFVSNFNIGGNIWNIENSFRYFKGFYDSNSPKYDTTFKETGEYYQQPNFLNVLGRSKFMYFTNNRKYSFKANSSCNYRQLKTAATWIFSANSNYDFMKNDSSFFPPPSRAYYGSHASLNGFNSFGLSINAGAAATVVLWRAFFVSALFIVGPEQQWRKYTYPDRSLSLSYLSLSGDLRFAIGLNFKRFYFTSYSLNDFVVYNSSFMGLSSRSLSGGFIMGYRFNSHVPEFYKKIQKTKLYLAL